MTPTCHIKVRTISTPDKTSASYMTENTAPNMMPENTMTDIKTNNVQSMTTEIDQITLKVIPEEPHTTEFKGFRAVSDDALSENMLQPLVQDDTSNDAEEVK